MPRRHFFLNFCQSSSISADVSKKLLIIFRADTCKCKLQYVTNTFADFYAKTQSTTWGICLYIKICDSYNSLCIANARLHENTHKLSLYRSPFLWANLPQEYKLQKPPSIFKRKTRQWNGEICVCRFCYVYEPNIGFI